MPTYTYQCQKCAHMIDAHRKIVDRDNAPDSCDQCGNKELKRLLAAPAIQMKSGHKHEYTKYGPRKG